MSVPCTCHRTGGFACVAEKHVDADFQALRRELDRARLERDEARALVARLSSPQEPAASKAPPDVLRRLECEELAPEPAADPPSEELRARIVQQGRNRLRYAAPEAYSYLKSYVDWIETMDRDATVPMCGSSSTTSRRQGGG